MTTLEPLADLKLQAIGKLEAPTLGIPVPPFAVGVLLTAEQAQVGVCRPSVGHKLGFNAARLHSLEFN